jgi:hypothetical protein
MIGVESAADEERFVSATGLAPWVSQKRRNCKSLSFAEKKIFGGYCRAVMALDASSIFQKIVSSQNMGVAERAA